MEVSAHLLMIILDYSSPPAAAPAQPDAPPTSAQQEAISTQRDSVFVDEQHPTGSADNLFKLYISKLHQKAVSCLDCVRVTVLISVLCISHSAYWCTIIEVTCYIIHFIGHAVHH